MSDTVAEQLARGERAERQVQAMLAQEISLRAEIERLRALVQSAYEEGLTEGQAQTGKLQTWEQSAARRAIQITMP